MKKLMMWACGLSMAAAVNASEVKTVAFNEACVAIPARVRFMQGENYGFSVEARDSVLARAVRCTVKDGVIRFTFGNSLQPGDSKYDAKKGVYYYGVNEENQVIMDENESEDMVITVVAPEMPAVTISRDYVAVSQEAVNNAKKDKAVLSMIK